MLVVGLVLFVCHRSLDTTFNTLVACVTTVCLCGIGVSLTMVWQWCVCVKVVCLCEGGVSV